MRRVAVLDKRGYLVGDAKLRGNQKLPAGGVEMDPGDLPLDGTYKWDPENRAFVPLGHGFPRIVSKPPVSETMVLYHIVRALGKKLPAEARAWADWYEANLRQRDEETALHRRSTRR